MNTKYWVVTILVLSLGTELFGQDFSLAHMEKNEKKYTVVIDAGNGGHDTGTIDQNGRNEKDINLDINIPVNLK